MLHYKAGVNHQSLYTFADQHNITVPGGTDPSVGFAGGYLMVCHQLTYVGCNKASIIIQGGGHRLVHT